MFVNFVCIAIIYYYISLLFLCYSVHLSYAVLRVIVCCAGVVLLCCASVLLSGVVLCHLNNVSIAITHIFLNVTVRSLFILIIRLTFLLICLSYDYYLSSSLPGSSASLSFSVDY